jgi:hypothetical protein
VPVLFAETGRKPGQIVGKTPWLQSVYADGDPRLIGRIVDVRLTEAMPTAWRARSPCHRAEPPRERSDSRWRPLDRRAPLTFDDNALLAVLYGNHDRHLVRIEQLANVQLSARGNQLAIAGAPDDAAVAHRRWPGFTSG